MDTWFTYGSADYYLSTSTKSLSGSVQACTAMAATLVRLTDWAVGSMFYTAYGNVDYYMDWVDSAVGVYIYQRVKD